MLMRGDVGAGVGECGLWMHGSGGFGGSGVRGTLTGGEPRVEVGVGVSVPLVIHLGVVLLVVLFGVLVVVVRLLHFVGFGLFGVTLLLGVVVLLVGLGVMCHLFVCFVGKPAIVGFVSLGLSGLAVSSGSSGRGGGIVGWCGLAGCGVEASKGAAWRSHADVAISQYPLGTKKEMKKKD
jgi:hypothetical protein